MSDTDATFNPEPGLLTRVRTLRDLFPWLALGDSLGPATSVLATLFSFAALILTEWGLGYLKFERETDFIPFSNQLSLDQSLPRGNFIDSLSYLNYPLNQRSTTEATISEVLLRITAQFGVWLIWALPAFYVMRRTVLTVAGKVEMSTDATLRLGLSRLGAMLGAPLLLLIGVALVAVLYGVVGWLSQFYLIGTLTGLAFYPLAIAAGLLLAGLYAGLLLMWSAAATEEFADSFDIASRGFEYLIQRPLRTVLYVVFAVIISSVMVFIVRTVLGLGNHIALSSVAWVADVERASYLNWIANHIVMAYSLNLTFALAAVIYLLLRRDANHQEMEEIWEPIMGTPVKLPALELDANGVPIPPASASPASMPESHESNG